jgi:hypothetical protein
VVEIMPKENQLQLLDLLKLIERRLPPNVNQLMPDNTYNPELNIHYYRKDLDLLAKDLEQHLVQKDQTYSFKYN